LKEFDAWCRSRFAIEAMEKADPSLNGVQVGRMDKEVRRVAFAVDACQESFRRAIAWKADVLLVHHGLFWGGQQAVTGQGYERLALLIQNDLALYAMHLPLDAHPELGNNIGIARNLKLEQLEPFGTWRGVIIGFKGILPDALKLEEVMIEGFGDWSATLGRLPFGKQEIRSVGIVSGGGTDEVEQAIEQGLDLFITGDASHQVYHRCLEAGINVIFGGHYQTEIWGVSLLAKRLRDETGLETCFIDIPTGF
jgi:dinuclear metal center YbgI/SA1388 family protein